MTLIKLNLIINKVRIKTDYNFYIFENLCKPI